MDVKQLKTKTMAQIINASIDLSKIDKSKIVEGKNGAKYYNFSHGK